MTDPKQRENSRQQANILAPGAWCTKTRADGSLVAVRWFEAIDELQRELPATLYPDRNSIAIPLLKGEMLIAGGCKYRLMRDRRMPR